MNRTGAVSVDGKTYINIHGSQPDVLVLYCGPNKAVFRVCPMTEKGEQWLRTYSPADSWVESVLLVPAEHIQKFSAAMHLAGLALGGES